ncbi:hypothetical protein GCM10022276_13070 [Sphingomonas limnosediminicola]|uniref:Uncharacterized protein n=1 Tax=Sphingomonas limnosediminicola TaxID=940133 RepID=A0ABP7L778_9SPHN
MTDAKVAARTDLEGRDEDVGVIDLNSSDALLVVSVNQTFPRSSAYDAARYAWRLAPARAAKVEYVLATKNRRVIGVFEPTEWKRATHDNFPDYDRPMPGRLGFTGRPAASDVTARYLGRDLPADFKFSGNGYRYAGSLA